MRRIVYMFILLTVNQVSFSQILERDPTKLVTGTGFINTRVVKPELIGKTQLFGEFREAKIKLNTNLSDQLLLIDYDVHRHTLVVLYRTVEYDLKLDIVDTVRIVGDRNQMFVNGRNIEGVDNTILAEVLFTGARLSLVKVFQATIKEPDYNALLNTGSRDYQIIRKDSYYLGNENNEFKIFKAKRQDFFKLDLKERHKATIKGADLNDEKEIIKIIELLNSDL